MIAILKKYRKLFIALAVGVIIATSLRLYFESYKDQFFTTILALAINMGGWVVVFGWLVDKRINADAPFAKTNKLTQVFMALLFIVFAIGDVLFSMILNTNRVEDILNTQPTKTSQAIVTRIEHRGKYGDTPYAIFTYTTNTGIIEQACYDKGSEYTVGDTCEVTYSVEYPEMYRLGKRINNNGE